jgi:hypothetical protein
LVATFAGGNFKLRVPGPTAQYTLVQGAAPVRSGVRYVHHLERTLAVADGRVYFTSTIKLMAVDLALQFQPPGLTLFRAAAGRQSRRTSAFAA